MLQADGVKLNLYIHGRFKQPGFTVPINRQKGLTHALTLYAGLNVIKQL